MDQLNEIVNQVEASARDGKRIIILSDRHVSNSKVLHWWPLLVSQCDHALRKVEVDGQVFRDRAKLVVEMVQMTPKEMAQVLAFGANMVNPWLAFQETEPADENEIIQKHRKFIERASEELVRIIAPGGMHDITGYSGNRSFAGLGLDPEISELLGTFTLDDARLIQEVAYYVERVEINEEVVRVKSHLNQLKSFLDGTGQVGKKLNFLLQEVSREVNTIGSKTPLPSVTIKIVEMKSEIEKIREQVQNIQ